MFTAIPTNMLVQIVQHTPSWVWALFAALIVLGGKQLFASRMGLRRVIVMPLAMTGLSIYGTVSAFGATPAAMLAWLAGLAVTMAFVLRRPVPHGVAYDAAERRFSVPGSAVPLALMMGIFGLKYAVGVSLAMHPALRLDPTLIVSASLLSGAFSGIFDARAARLLRLAMAAGGSATAAPASTPSTPSTPSTQLAA